MEPISVRADEWKYHLFSRAQFVPALQRPPLLLSTYCNNDS
jgi:hypothetical protein